MRAAGPNMTAKLDKQDPEDPRSAHTDLSERILSVSATMVGVCLTVIGLVRVADELRKVSSLTDNIVAMDSVVFLSSGLLAYASIRSRKARNRQRLERIADMLFIAGLVGMVAVCALLSYEIL